MKDHQILIFALTAGGLGLLYALAWTAWITGRPYSSERLQSVAASLRERVHGSLRGKYLVAWAVALAVAVALYPLGTWLANGFVAGVVGSALAVYLGAVLSTATSLQGAETAQRGTGQALAALLRGGSAAGLLVTALGLISVAGPYWLAGTALAAEGVLRCLVGVGLGASVVSLFLRLSDSLYPRQSDTGADQGGESSGMGPDQADAIAGDGASLTADLYESFVLALVVAMWIAGTVFGPDSPWVEFPLLIGGLAIPATLIGGLFGPLGRKLRVIGALYRGLLVAMLVVGGLLYYVVNWFLAIPDVEPAFDRSGLLAALAVGLALAGLLAILGEHAAAQSFSPVKRIAAASESGPAANLIAGAAAGMEVAGLPVVAIAAGVVTAYQLGGGLAGSPGAGLFAVALSAAVALSLVGMVTAIGSYGIVAGRVEGLAALADRSDTTRAAAEPLAAAGLNGRAIAKGYAVAVAGWVALLLVAAYFRSAAPLVGSDPANPALLMALLVGAFLPYGFAAALLKSAGRRLEQARSHLREAAIGQELETLGATPGFLSLLRGTLLPAFIPLGLPIVTGLLAGRSGLGALLVGCVATGLVQGVAMTSGGGGWEGARRYIEGGRFGGRLSGAHQAAITGDTVAGVYKDIAGPALGPMIKAIGLLALLLIPWIP
ncbi:sodium/proton-translocating pyrophosphatase [Candidatus Methylocalor cossyra]|uniref:Pyrophosphate-energized proton pump n=1 Tax=Candidatus Methylocalor cossyra TaxID=3108543 RepID=A0ABM9NJP7_9GAMM